jgi:hypothetical protein
MLAPSPVLDLNKRAPAQPNLVVNLKPSGPSSQQRKGTNLAVPQAVVADKLGLI